MSVPIGTRVHPRSSLDQKAKGYIVLANPQGHKKNRVLLVLAKGVRRIVTKREAAKKVAASKKKDKKGRKGKRR